MLAVESTFGQAECQLLTYLATMRAFVQGFYYSDENMFCFLPIDLDRSVLTSRIFERRYDLAGIFNWVINMINAASRSTSPTKLGTERDSEIQGF